MFDSIILECDGLRLWQVGRRDVCVDRVAEHHEEFQVRIIHIRNRGIRGKFAAPVTARPEGKSSVGRQVGGSTRLAGSRFTTCVGRAIIILSVRLQPGHLSLHRNQGVTLRHGFRGHDLRKGGIRRNLKLDVSSPGTLTPSTVDFRVVSPVATTADNNCRSSNTSADLLACR